MKRIRRRISVYVGLRYPDCVCDSCVDHFSIDGIGLEIGYSSPMICKKCAILVMKGLVKSLDKLTKLEKDKKRYWL